MSVARRCGPLLAVVAFATCSGSGSDIGPRLARLSGESCRVQVLDDAGRGVVGARVTLVGTSLSTVTGRNGRGDLLASPRGTRLVRVDGGAAAAQAGDHLATLTVAEAIVGPDFPSPIHLPDLTAAATIPTGTQTTTTSLTSAGDANITVANGISVGTADAASEVELRVGDLQAHHLPGDLPVSGSGAILFGQGVFLGPEDATFSPGIDLDLPDDLAAGTGVVQLYHLDPDTGTWAAVANVTAAGGRLVASGQVTRGGLYAFGAAVGEAAVTGLVRDLDIDGTGVDTAAPVPGALVRVDQRRAITGADGRFTVRGVARRKADDSGRLAQVEVFAGGGWLPVVVPTTIDVSGATPAAPVDVGELDFDSVPAGNIRVLQIRRARIDARRLVRVSSARGGVTQVAVGDANGQAMLEDVPSGVFGVQEGWRRAPLSIDFNQAITFLVAGQRWNDLYLFTQSRGWYQGTRNCRIYVCDELGGGPVTGASLVQGKTAGQGLLGLTQDNGAAFGERSLGGRITAVSRSERGADSVTHAFSISSPSADKVELPLQQVRRAPLGAFDRHGVVAGEVLGIDLGKQHELRTRRPIFLREWWDDVVDPDVAPLQSRLPIDVVPGTTADYRAGVAVGGGDLVVTEFTAAGGRTLERVGMLLDFVPTEAAVVTRDLALDLDAATTFAAPQLLLGAPAEVDTASFVFALALELDEGRVVDVDRALQGNLTIAGDDLEFALPALTGALDGRRWLALLQGQQLIGGVTYRHEDLLALPVSGDLRLQAFPSITSPSSAHAAPGGTVSAGGFPVAFALPAGAVCGSIELRATGAGEQLRWSVFVRPDETGFDFVGFPTDVPSPLVAGRTYELTVSAWFAPPGTYTSVPYGDLVSFAQTIGPRESGVTQITSATLTVTAN
ncbi:MAG: hypothetical protein H6835_14825 [Planctomycetes bacterium]|nr:hypothetical protein [Planctomycetota bacterium]